MAFWSEYREELLKNLVATGLSASQIAARLGGFEGSPDGGRSAVCGKIDRMRKAGLIPLLGEVGVRRSMRVGGQRGAKAAHITRARKRKKGKTGNWIHLQAYGYIDTKTPARKRRLEADGYAPPPDDYLVPQAQRKDILDLEDHHCRWPIDKPQGGFEFCGGEKVPGLSYCSHHSRRAYQSPALKVREIQQLDHADVGAP